ncbi:MAG TPA: class III lanthionine synthetase LanKC [Actinophytocola sp.]|uniref:class III lanthionine synthetase LanKC n=1 Tax=Actinophytocola sp. TaxID=1872138 RepID=UPI002DBA0D04|nr:class III lanthionine synthetase LanKC [Actinophytocola sp.]HEU5469254.1 class III lanthionine synthetase LanKC [Actinophytocola sp.]
MIFDASFTFANADYYAPLAAADPGLRYLPSRPPAGWVRRDFDVWTEWAPPGAHVPEQGWKVHVSAALVHAQVVLDVVTAACADHGVPFKHLAGRNFFLGLHGKHANRAQSGKFCAAYPQTPELAGELLRRLEHDLAGVSGPYVLTDRRFGASACVSYRYGSFRGGGRMEADGTTTHTVRAVDGSEVPDERRAEFLLPPGVVDPFAPVEPLSVDAPVSFGGYTFDAVLQHSNGGGAYQASSADGTTVFIKEARAHNGYSGDGLDARARLRREYLTLRALHAATPGLCPEPLDYFSHWEHTYLVTEFVPGRQLVKWMLTNTPAIKVGQRPQDFADYYRRCMSILDQLTATVARLHALGYVFVDLNSRNVMVDDDDRIRLIDFESARSAGEHIRAIGTPGYLPPEATDPKRVAAIAPTHYDNYGLSAIAQMLLFPLHPFAERSPEVLDHLRAGLAELAPVPPVLWRAATRFRPAGRRRALPRPDEVRADPLTHLGWLRDRTADALEAMAEPDQPHRIYPCAPDGYRTNNRCVAHGTAGVLHALRLAGREIDPKIVARLRDDSLRGRDDLPPGLLFGTAGIAWVLADLGERDAAGELLAAAGTHPLAGRSATLAGGAAGVALAELAAYCRDDDQNHLDRAAGLLEAVPDGPELAGRLGRDDAAGLSQGRPGLALALYYLGRLGGDPDHLDRGLRLLHEELAHAVPWERGALGFRVSTSDKRTMPYLYAGSAGYVHVLARYLSVRAEPELAAVLEQCLAGLATRFTVSGGLFQGQAGLALVQSDIAALLGRPELAARAIDSGRALFQYAIPGPTGVRWAGGYGYRFSADLWSGSAGVLLTLHRLVSGQRDPLFTLDEHVRTGQQTSAPISGAGR